MTRFNDKILKIIFVFSIFICIFLFILPIFLKYYEHTKSPITTVTSCSNDNMISVSWDGYCKSPNELFLSIYNDNVLYDTICLDKNTNSYDFFNGEHGKLYYFELTILDFNQTPIETFRCKSLFIDYSKLPELPFINIVTNDGITPSSTQINPPEGYWGVSITDNDYIEGYLTLTSADSLYSISSEMKIKVRGNTSTLAAKKPYKIKLESKVDLLGRQEGNFKNDEWILLNCGTNFNTYIGSIISSTCRNDWQPSFQYVNLMINGDWKGCYMLIENIKRDKSRLDISKEGFIVENDPYWWNGEVNFFRGNFQYGPFAYTIKYPSDDKLDLKRAEEIKQYINSVECMIYNNDFNYSNYLDQSSFARWLIVHDILGTSDFAGSNMYMYHYSYVVDGTEENLLRMGPAWDFDSIMSTSNTWSAIHTSEVFWYQKLFTYENFKTTYIQEWNSAKTSILNISLASFNDFINVQSDALQESWDLDATRYKEKYLTVNEQQSLINTWIQDRIKWIDQNIDNI